MSEKVECTVHGYNSATFICEHLFEDPNQTWFGGAVSEENPWPDSWCEKCDEYYDLEGEWNDKNERHLKVKLICSGCYESISPDYKK
jgi:hypothetical protein